MRPYETVEREISIAGLLGDQAAQLVEVVLRALQPQRTLYLRLGQLEFALVIGGKRPVIVIIRIAIVVAPDPVCITLCCFHVAEAAVKAGQVGQRLGVLRIDLECQGVCLDGMVILFVARIDNPEVGPVRRDIRVSLNRFLL